MSALRFLTILGPLGWLGKESPTEVTSTSCEVFWPALPSSSTKVISSSEELSRSDETGSKGGRLTWGQAYALSLVWSSWMASGRGGELLYKAVWSCIDLNNQIQLYQVDKSTQALQILTGGGGLLAEKSVGTKGTASTSSSTRLTHISAPSVDNSSANICEGSWVARYLNLKLHLCCRGWTRRWKKENKTDAPVMHVSLWASIKLRSYLT